MTATNSGAPRVSRESGRNALGILLTPLAILLIGGIVMPRLNGGASSPVNHDPWASMARAESFVFARHPNVRKGYEKLLAGDEKRLTVLDQRIASTRDPERLDALQRQRVAVTYGIQTIHQILARFPTAPGKHAG